MKTRSVTILLTNMCNLNCVYCYENNKSKREIDVDKACEIIEKEMRMDDGYEHIEFNLFGGEPFLKFDIIKGVYEYLDNTSYKKNWSLGLITNGTVFDDAIKKWLAEHKEKLVCTLSVDGTKTMQDKNRNNSFDKLDLDFFVDVFDVPYAKMTISEYTVDGICDGLLFLQNKGFYVNAGVAYGVEPTDVFLKKLSEQLDQYYNIMKKESYCDKSSLLRFPYETIFMSNGKYFRTCDAGKIAKAYDVDGKEYPCYMFLPLSLSEKQIKDIEKIVFPEIEVDECNIPMQCKSCPIYAVCHNCYCNNYKKNGSIYIVDESVCKVNKLMIRKQAEFFAWMWNEKRVLLPEKEEKMFVESLIRVLKMRG